MKANFPNQRAIKMRMITVAMTAPRTPTNPVTDTSVLGGLKCDSKAACGTEHGKVNCCNANMQKGLD